MRTTLRGSLQEVGEELFIEPPRWIWHAPDAEMDVSVPLRRSLPVAGFQERIALLNGRLPSAVSRIWREGDHLNLQFHPLSVVQWIMEWSQDEDLVWSELGLRQQDELDWKEIPASWGPILQGAEVLAGIPGWVANAEGCHDCIRHTKLIRNLLRHAEILSIPGGDPSKRQRNAIECVILDIRSLWTAPILHPAMPADSAFKQAILRIWVAFARRAGAKWTGQCILLRGEPYHLPDKFVE